MAATRGRWRAWLALALPVLLPVVLLVVLRSRDELDVFYRDAGVHLVVVSGIAGCALLVALAAASASARAAHHGPVWLAAGCLSIGVLMLAHGLVTPTVLDQPVNSWVGRLPYLAITCFAGALALAGRPRNEAWSVFAARRPVLVMAAAALTLTAFAAVLVSDPTQLGGDRTLAAEDSILWAVAAFDAVVLLSLAVTHWQRWRLGHDPVQYALCLAAISCTAALLSLRTGELWRLSWWDYHGFLLAGYVGAVYAVAVRYRRTRAVDSVLAATFENDPMRHIVDGYPEALTTLVAAVEVKDRYTHGHSERTARLAVQLGVRMGLTPDTLRALARGAYLHDVGKIAIPDEILNKPGRLTPEERQVIETHPEVGYQLVEPSPALAEALPVVLHHHERWDGRGYPHALHDTAIPLIARVAAVADVWDALTSDRSYRRGVSPRVALAHVLAGRGTHFDPLVVDVMVALATDWGYTLGPEDGSAEIAWEAAETCHEVAVGANTT